MKSMTRISLKSFQWLLACALLLALAACSRPPKRPALPAGSVVLAFGDSVTYGTGASAGEDWPALLSAATGWRIVNAGIPGDTAQNGRERIADLLREHRPALVIIEIGGNDFLQRRSPRQVKEDVRAILSAVRQSGAKVVLVAVPEVSLLSAVVQRPSDAALYAELGKEEKVPVIANVFADVLANSSLRADAIHPNARGYRKMAEGIVAELKKLGFAN